MSQLAMPTTLHLPDDNSQTVIGLIETPQDLEQGMALPFQLDAVGKDRIRVSSQGRVL